jgi:hypothetical protein
MARKTDKLVLLGEAPKSPNGFAFAPEDFTTQQLAASISVHPTQLYEYFWLTNVFDFPLPPDGWGDSFPMATAVDILSTKYFERMDIICVGVRVRNALEHALGIEGIPENDLRAFRPHSRKGTWHLGYIPHPASRQLSPNNAGLVLPIETQRFLRWAAGMSR